MIYEGKEYPFKVGDKVEINAGRLREEKGVIYQIWPHGSVTVDFGRFRAVLPPYYLELIEEAPVMFKSGDKVKVVGSAFDGEGNFEGCNGLVEVNAYGGDYKVKFADGTVGFFPPSSLELIHQPTDDSLSEWNVEEGGYFVITGDSTGHMLRKNAVVVAQGLNWEKYFEAIELDNNFVWCINYKDVRRASEEELELIANDAISRAEKSLNCSVPINSLKNRIENKFAVMSELIIAKNENYGDSFSKQYQKYGMVSVEMRLNDKFMRLEQLVAGEKDKVGESIEDTLKDIIGYATLALIELEGEK